MCHPRIFSSPHLSVAPISTFLDTPLLSFSKTTTNKTLHFYLCTYLFLHKTSHEAAVHFSYILTHTDVGVQSVTQHFLVNNPAALYCSCFSPTTVLCRLHQQPSRPSARHSQAEEAREPGRLGLHTLHSRATRTSHSEDPSHCATAHRI